MSSLSLNIDQLLLDSDNPRIGTAKNQRDALQKIISDQEDKLVELADDIVREGMSPIDRLLVLKEKDKFVVVEGNRRLAALKILSNPAVLGGLEVDSSVKKKLESSAKNFDRKSVEPISAFCVSDREKAIRWIYLRHTGENSGRGVVEWNGIAKARFRGSNPGLQALEFVKKYGGLNDTQLALLESFPITTLERLLSSKGVKELIGVEVKSGKLRSGLPAKELVKPLRRMVLDLAEKRKNVSDLKKTDQQVDYIKSLDKNDMPSMKKVAEVRDVEEIHEDITKVKPAASSRGSVKRSIDLSERKNLIPKSLKLNITNAKVSEIYKELRNLQIDSYPNSCAVLFRVFLELSVDHYFTFHKLDPYFRDKKNNKLEKKLAKKVQEVVDDLVSKGSNKKDFSAVIRALSDRKSPLSIELLHDYVHNLFHTPKTRDLRAAWDDAEPFFNKIWA